MSGMSVGKGISFCCQNWHWTSVYFNDSNLCHEQNFHGSNLISVGRKVYYECIVEIYDAYW
jgi:hypothetical protein